MGRRLDLDTNIEINIIIYIKIYFFQFIYQLVDWELAPFAADINGVIRLSNALTRVEERLTEFLMHGWASDPDFPEADDGPDLVIGDQSPDIEKKLSLFYVLILEAT